MSAPVLGFDLTRLDGGAAAADVLLRALTVTADDLPAIAAAQPDEWSRVGLLARRRLRRPHPPPRRDPSAVATTKIADGGDGRADDDRASWPTRWPPSSGRRSAPSTA